MTTEVRPLILPTEADAELRMREMGLHGTSRSEALRIRRRAFKISDLGHDDSVALAQAIQALGGDLVLANKESVESVIVIAQGQLHALAELVSGRSELAGAINRLADGLVPGAWTDAAGNSLLRSEGTTLMGILNVTPDSFSDGGRYADPILAEERALKMVEEGADIIDVGGMSTRPGAPEVPPQEELARVLPVIGRLARKISVPISVDTYRADVAEKALDAGATIVNDVSGFSFEPRLAKVCASKGAAVVLMHTPSKSHDMMEHTEYRDLFRDLRRALAGLAARAVDGGIAPERIAIDPGFGFGKSADQGWEMLRRLGEFSGLGRPLVVGVSRKSMFKQILGDELPADQRDAASGAAAAAAVLAGAQIIRTHNVRISRDCVAVADRMRQMPRL